ncbi:kinesin [Klebsormidium nitens]|uniref:Kinesin n=1 Tax=Klebsormidium nitens TaxID=105231 RepID=A0A1Y1ICJ8_KLENI|nr:kinesin [Klebsormidium nitens]|eukprot:GAQ88640.1 kinesin [Klebsormidium nitens]
MDVSMSVDGPANFLSGADKVAAAVDKGGYNFRKRRSPTDFDQKAWGPISPKREKREGGFPSGPLTHGTGTEKKQPKSPHKRRPEQTPERIALRGREQDYEEVDSGGGVLKVDQARQKSPSRRYEQQEPPRGGTDAKPRVEKARHGTPQRDDPAQKSPSRRYEDQKPPRSSTPAKGGVEKARQGSPWRERTEAERAKSPGRHVGGPSAFMASEDKGPEDGGGRAIVKDEVTVLKRQLKDEMAASKVLQKKLREFEEERAHDLKDLTRAMDTLKAKEYELEMYVSNHQKNRASRQGQEQEVRSRSQELEGQLAAIADECGALRDVLERRTREIDDLRRQLSERTAEAQRLGELVDKQAAELANERSRAGDRWRDLHEQICKEIGAVHPASGDAPSPDASEAEDAETSERLENETKAAVRKLVSEYEELKRRFALESAARKKYYNEVLEMKGNIRVFCRCRPLAPSEISSGQSNVVDFDVKGENELLVRSGPRPGDKKAFKFDRVFNPEADQAEVFADTAPVVMSVLDGFNVCIFAYGQTGTGKTFTMEGTPANRGVNYRTIDELFQLARQRHGEARYDVSVSVLEIYNEQIRDLLAAPGSGQKKLEIRQGHQGNHVPGLTEHPVTCADEAWELLQSGSRSRSVGATNANEHSSRSHCMLGISVKCENKVTGETTRSRLWLVDLAGSERVGKSEASGDRLKEAQSINKSLAALGDVIAALTTKSAHVPYRNSKLTHLLQDSLGGDSKALMFVQISPAESDAGESLCSLQFASRVRGIELGPAKRQVDGNELFKYKQLVASAKQEAKAREEALKQLQEGVRAVEGRLQIKDKLCATLSEKVRIKETREAELEAQLLAERRALLEARAAVEAAQNELHMLRLAGNRAPANPRLETGSRDTGGGLDRGPYSQATYHERQEGGRGNSSSALHGGGDYRASESDRRHETGHQSGAERPYQEPHSTSDRVTAAMAAAQAAIAERKALIESARQETSPLGKQNPKPSAGDLPTSAAKPPGLPRPDFHRENAHSGLRETGFREAGLRETAGMTIGTSGGAEAFGITGRGAIHTGSDSTTVDASVSLGDWGRGDSRGGMGASVNSRPYNQQPGDRRLPPWSETAEAHQGGQNDPGRPPPTVNRAPRVVASRFNVAVTGPTIGTPLRVRPTSARPPVSAPNLQPGLMQNPGFGAAGFEEERRGSVYRTAPTSANPGPVSGAFLEERRGSVYRALGGDPNQPYGNQSEDSGDDRSGSRGSTVAAKQGDAYDASRAPLAGLKPNRIDAGPGSAPLAGDAKVKGARPAFSKGQSGGMAAGAQRVRNGGQVRKQFIATQAAAIAAQTNKPVELVLREKMWQ